jgi:hypothetical protein
MTEENGFIVKNVAYVVNSAINRVMGKVEDAAWFQQLAIEWLSEEGIYTALPALRVKRVTVSASKQIVLPKDCARYTKIAIDLGGKLWTLTMDSDITLPPNFDTGVTPDNATETSSGSGVYFMPHYWNGQYYGGLFALGGGFNDAYYRYDEATRTISFLDNRIGREVVIEYLSNGADINIDSLVPHYWITPLRNWLILKAAEYRRSEFPLVDYGVALRNYEDAIMNASITSGATPQEILDAWYDAPGLTVR